MSDNTIQKDIGDVVEILTNPYISELKQIGRDIRRRSQMQDQEQRAFEDSQLTKQLESQNQVLQAEMKHDLDLIDRKGEWSYKEAYLNAIGKDAMSTNTNEQSVIQKAYENEMKANNFSNDMDLKNRELDRKVVSDADSKAIELQKIKQKNEELKLRREQENTKRFVATINKN